ncbi:hypothetical protein, partial [Escherichia coli]|uniref:hypothetical protein n=1 Tax=Escherichia coli TaxID=562 RepID=UPI001BDD17AB
MGKAGWLLLQHCGCHTMALWRKKQSVGEWIHRCRQTTTHTFGLPGIGAPVVFNSGYSQNCAHRC